MMTIWGSLLGFLAGILPEVLKCYRDGQIRKHELSLLDRQIALKKMGCDQQ